MELRPLHDQLGVEVSGLDLLGTVTQSEVDALRAALAEHQLLLFRLPAAMAPERQVEVSSWFGPPVSNNGEALWSVLRNANAAGGRRLPFHADFTYTDSPIKGISLHAIAVPAGGTTTSFLSGVHAWATLPPDRQALLADKTAHHVHAETIIAHDMPAFHADHPVRFDHPRVGKPVLFVTEYHARRINGLDAAESDAVLAELFAHLYRPENIYAHDWRLHDLVIWDNLAVQHARKDRSDPGEGERALQRVALNEVGFAELIERARAQERAAAIA